MSPLIISDYKFNYMSEKGFVFLYTNLNMFYKTMCYFYYILLSSLSVLVFDIIFAVEVPKNIIHVCKRNDPDLNQCIINSGNHMSQFLAKGIPEYNIPSLEPLELDEFISEFSAGMQIKASNVKAFGCSNYQVKKLKFNKTKLSLNLEVSLPKLRILAKYKVSGQFLNFLVIEGAGNMEANVSDCRALVKVESTLIQEANETYLRFTSMKIKVKVGSGRAYLDNFFNGNQLLGDVINTAINDNFQELLKELLPVIERNLASRFLVATNKIIELYTYDQLMPPN